MRSAATARETFRRFCGDRSGAALVEFAVVVPLMLIMFAFTIEGGRLLWTHQVIVSGVRDAARYVARVAPRNICTTGGSITTYSGSLSGKVQNSATTGNSLLLPQVTVNSVAASLSCVAGSYRVNPAPVATVTANVTIQHPFGSVFSLVGDAPGALTYDVVDRARIHGE